MANSRTAVSAALALLLCAAAIGCASHESDQAGSGGSGGSGGSAGAPAGPSSLALSSPTLTMVPGEVRSLSVTASPPGVYRVRFALLGDARDASLDISELDTDESGAASVALTAPTESTTFTLRASSGDAVTQAGVSVSASGFATLQVKPVYDGKRSVTYWVASVRTGTTCAELSGKPIDDGDLKGSAPFAQVPQVSSVPVGPALAVTLRGGYSIAGCLDVANVRAGEVNQVSVELADLPMNLAETDLLMELGIASASPQEWATALDGVAMSSGEAMLGSASDDIGALLAAMAEATGNPADQTAFATTRAQKGWDGKLVVALGSSDVLRAQVLAWMASGADSLDSPSTFSGALRSAGKYPGPAVFELATVASIPAAEAGFSFTNQVPKWSAEPGDTVLLSTLLPFAPSRLLAALAEKAALVDVPTASTISEALAETLSCNAVAVALVASGASPGESYLGCDLACTEMLCQTALESLWQKARDASLSDPNGLGAVNVTASGEAGVDDNARPTGFSGSWVGSLKLGPALVPVNGPASAFLPPPPS